MANDYFNWPTSLNRFVPFDTARAGDVNNALDSVSTGLDGVDTDIKRSIKLPTGNHVLNLNAGQRANLILSFDASGNVAAVAGGGRWRGDWVTGTVYVIGDYVRDDITKNIYSTVSQHTSGVLLDDISANRLQLAINVEDVEIAQAAAESARDAAQGFAGDASASASAASGSASAASGSASAASGSASAALASENATATLYDNFDDRYLGVKASDPTLDNDGNALLDGALYFDTTLNVMKVYDLGNTVWRRTTPTTSEQTAINAVSANEANVNTVATNIAGVNNVSTNMAAVLDAPTQASNAAASASLAGTSASQAAGSASSASASASSASASAASATSSASAAQSSANAINVTANVSAWVSGTTYAQGTVVYSTSNWQNYRRIVAGAGTTDPSADLTNWRSVGFGPAGIGTSPDKVPLNQYLGELAYMNTESVVIRPQADANPATVRGMVFQLTNDTTLVVKVRGVDGVVRSTSLTLA